MGGGGRAFFSVHALIKSLLGTWKKKWRLWPTWVKLWKNWAQRFGKWKYKIGSFIMNAWKLAWIILIVYMYEHECMYVRACFVCVGVWGRTCMCSCVGKTEEDVMSSLRWCLFLNWILCILGAGSTCLCLPPALGLRLTEPFLPFYTGPGIWTQIFTSAQQVLYLQGFSMSPVYLWHKHICRVSVICQECCVPSVGQVFWWAGMEGILSHLLTDQDGRRIVR